MKKIFYFVPAACYYALIFVLSSKPYQIEVEVPFFDKWVHLVEFGVLGFFVSFGFFKSLRSSLKIKINATFLSGISLGILDEIHQYFVPGRNSDIFDAAVDAIGIFLGLLVYWYLSQKMKLKILDKL